jgi:histidinol-phosphate aminotransferase
MTIRVNPSVAKLEAYVPGEQPRDPDFIKLNTNENPYPVPDEVLRAVQEASVTAFQKYPDPGSSSLRAAIGERLRVPVQQILAGNGSDEVLRLLCHAFLCPGDSIGMLNPTYTLYRTLAAMFGAESRTFEVRGPDYAFPEEAISAEVRIFFLPNPNPPIGTRYPAELVSRMAAARPDRLLVVDEAYIDFASGDCVDVFRAHDNVAITRTFSKSYSLAGLRVGFVVAKEPIIGELEKIKDSYNLNRVSQAAAEAAWRAQGYYDARTREIVANRTLLATELAARGFEVPASEGNFVFARRADARDLYTKLKERKVLVRYFDTPNLRDGMRVTVGTGAELKALLSAIDDLS